MANGTKFFKKRSKRIPTKLRVKAEKKVKEHNRKLRKEKRKNPEKFSKLKRKDPGVPSDCPFKEKILEEVEAMRKLKEEEKEIRRKKLVEFRKNGAQVEPLSEKENLAEESMETEEEEAKSYLEVIKENKIILHTIDARNPKEQLDLTEQMIAEAIAEQGAGHKRHLLVLTKCDLVPKDNLRDWLRYLRNSRVATAFRSSTATNGKKSVGVDSLMFLLQSYCNKKTVQDKVQIGVVGLPGTGKRSLIASLLKSKAFASDKRLCLASIPGTVPSTFWDDEANVIQLVNSCDKEFLQLRYSLPDYKDASDFLSLLSKNKKKDYSASSSFKSDMIDGGNFKYYTHSPSLADAENMKMANELDRADFNLDKLETVENGDLEQLSRSTESEYMLLDGAKK